MQIFKTTTLLLLFLTIFGFFSCQKSKIDFNYRSAQNREILLTDVYNTGEAILNSFSHKHKLLYDSAQFTNYKNYQFVRVPLQNSSGYFYFHNGTDGILQTTFIRKWGNSIDSGYVEFANLTHKTYKFGAYKKNTLKTISTLKNPLLYFNKIYGIKKHNTTSANINGKFPTKTIAEEDDFSEDDSSTDYSDDPMTSDDCGPGSTKCPRDPNGSPSNFWNFIGNLFDSVSAFLADLFSIFSIDSTDANDNITVNPNGTSFILTTADPLEAYVFTLTGFTNDPNNNSFPDWRTHGLLYSRINELKSILQNNPYALVPCDSTNLLPLGDSTGYGLMFQRVAQFKIPEEITDSISSLNHSITSSFATYFGIQLLTEASSAIVNCDFYPVRIQQLPSGFTSSSFLEYYRTHLNDFIDPTLNISFAPYVDSHVNETTKFYSPYENSVGAIVHIKMPDNGTVVESGYYDYNQNGFEKHRFIFSTMASPLDDNHPVSGNREFGIYNSPTALGEFTFYSMGVDRVSDWMFNIVNGYKTTIFNGGDELWSNMQKNMVNYINNNGGKATYFSPAKVTARPNWDDVKLYLMGLIKYTELKRRMGC